MHRPRQQIPDARPVTHQACPAGRRQADGALAPVSSATRARSSSTSPGAVGRRRRSRPRWPARTSRRSSSSGRMSMAARASRFPRHAPTVGHVRPRPSSAPNASRRSRCRAGRAVAAARAGRGSPRAARSWPRDGPRYRLVVDPCDLRPVADSSRTAMSGSGSRVRDGRTAPRHARSEPARSSPASARPPTTSARASMRRDLPAPVSPVSTVSPGPSPTCTRSRRARSATASSSSAIRSAAARPCVAAAPRTGAPRAARRSGWVVRGR